MSALHYYRTAERPDLKLWLLDDDGTLVNFASGYTFVFKLGNIPGTAAFTKTSGITGAAGSGTETSGTPNATISFTAGELDGLAAGAYIWQLRATSGSLDRLYQDAFRLHDVLT
jgi:hypothetical protein